jgi:hypothetical protein
VVASANSASAVLTDRTYPLGLSGDAQSADRPYRHTEAVSPIRVDAALRHPREMPASAENVPNAERQLGGPGEIHPISGGSSLPGTSSSGRSL